MKNEKKLKTWLKLKDTDKQNMTGWAEVQHAQKEMIKPHLLIMTLGKKINMEHEWCFFFYFLVIQILLLLQWAAICKQDCFLYVHWSKRTNLNVVL